MRKSIFLIFLSLVLLGAGYTYWFYYRSYGDGFREGYFQKFSRKGNLFKTYEGELVLEGFGTRSLGKRNANLSANYFYFSVLDEAIADTLEKSIGKSVKVHYTQYLRSLPWRGDNYSAQNHEPGQYIVDRVVLVTE
ncbi:MAG: hypothetical protein IT256_05100 [Chitinophagaceae bacterium]|nr:hypothetical protein [Chitinophagaceae bacterium]